MKKVNIDNKEIFIYNSLNDFLNWWSFFESFSCIILSEFFSIDDATIKELKEKNCKHISFSENVVFVDEFISEYNTSKYNIWIDYLKNIWVDDALIYWIKFATHWQIYIKNIIVINELNIDLLKKIESNYNRLPNPWSAIWTKIWAPIFPQSTTIWISWFPENFTSNMLYFTNWVEKFSKFYLFHRESNKKITITFSRGIFNWHTKIINYTDGRDLTPVDLWFFNDEKIDSIEIWWYFWDLLFEQLNFEEVLINNLTIKNSAKIIFDLRKPFLSDKEEYIKKRRKHKITLENINDLEKFEIKGDKYTNIELYLNDSNFDNTNFFISNIRISKLHIRNSNLWKGIFNGVNVIQLTMEDVTMNDCIFNWCSFPEELEKISNNKKQKDNYRQLKYVMDKNWSHTDANKFYAKEMETYMYSIGLRKWISWFFSIFKKKLIWGETESFANKFSLWCWFQFSNFWNNWIRCFSWIILLALASTAFNYTYNHLICIPSYFWSCNQEDIFNYAYLVDYSKLFLSFLYPLYGLKKDFIDNLDNWLTLWFMIYKISYTYLLWSLILSFKRVSKR